MITFILAKEIRRQLLDQDIGKIRLIRDFE